MSNQIIDKALAYLGDNLPSASTIAVDAVNVASGTSCTLAQTITVSKKGLYIIIFGGAFGSNSTGYRQISLSSTTSANAGRYTPSYQAVNGDQTRFSGISVENIDSDNSKYYLYARQNSGATLQLYPYARLIRLGDVNNT